jgi:hypothetical protein
MGGSLSQLIGMQKIDFVSTLEEMVEKLFSNEIVSVIRAGFDKPGSDYEYSKVIPLLFSSKSNYDQIKNESRYLQVINSFGAENLYSETTLTYLSNVFRGNRATSIIQIAPALHLYLFHNSLLKTLELSKNLLFNKDLRNEINNGVLILQIIIEGEGLETEKYIKIFSALEILITTISKIVSEGEIKSEIISIPMLELKLAWKPQNHYLPYLKKYGIT